MSGLRVSVRFRRGVWQAQLGGREVAHGEYADPEAGEIDWFLDDHPVTGKPWQELKAAIQSECERLAQYDCLNTDELDRALRRGKLRAINN